MSTGLIGLSAGHDPASEPGFGIPPLPSALWHVTQLAANICAPEFGSPVKLIASPGPPGLDGRGTPDDATLAVVEVAAGIIIANVEVTNVAFPDTPEGGVPVAEDERKFVGADDASAFCVGTRLTKRVAVGATG